MYVVVLSWSFGSWKIKIGSSAIWAYCGDGLVLRLGTDGVDNNVVSSSHLDATVMNAKPLRDYFSKCWLVSPFPPYVIVKLLLEKCVRSLSLTLSVSLLLFLYLTLSLMTCFVTHYHHRAHEIMIQGESN